MTLGVGFAATPIRILLVASLLAPYEQAVLAATDAGLAGSTAPWTDSPLVGSKWKIELKDGRKIKGEILECRFLSEADYAAVYSMGNHELDGFRLPALGETIRIYKKDASDDRAYDFMAGTFVAFDIDHVLIRRADRTEVSVIPLREGKISDSGPGSIEMRSLRRALAGGIVPVVTATVVVKVKGKATEVAMEDIRGMQRTHPQRVVVLAVVGVIVVALVGYGLALGQCCGD